MNLPKARRDDLLTTNLDDEVVVYDPESKQAHSLNRTAVAVWNHCDGTTTIEDLQRLVSDEIGIKVDQAAVWLAVRKLERAHLLLGKIGTASPMSRREVLGKAGRYGAIAMATPLIASALVPVAAAAASVGVCPAGTPPCALNGACICEQPFAGPRVCATATDGISCVPDGTVRANCPNDANGYVCVPIGTSTTNGNCHGTAICSTVPITCSC